MDNGQWTMTIVHGPIEMQCREEGSRGSRVMGTMAAGVLCMSMATYVDQPGAIGRARGSIVECRRNDAYVWERMFQAEAAGWL
jgi:hypothetical protein